MSRSKIIALILAGLGIYTLVTTKNTSLNTLGVVLALASGVSYGITIILLGINLLKSLDHNVITFYVSTGATLGMLIYGGLTNTIVTTLNFNLLLSYTSIAIISTIIAMLLLLKAIKKIGTASTSILGTFEPIVSVILGVILFGESLTISLIIGTCLILISTIILAQEK